MIINLRLTSEDAANYQSALNIRLTTKKIDRASIKQHMIDALSLPNGALDNYDVSVYKNMAAIYPND